jgi:hypothetical protein
MVMAFDFILTQTKDPECHSVTHVGWALHKV